jgi:HlyD family secretion protein
MQEPSSPFLASALTKTTFLLYSNWGGMLDIVENNIGINFMNNGILMLRNKKKQVIIWGIILAFVLGLILLLQKSDDGSVYTVKRENIINTVLVNGTYTTASQTKVSSPAKGIITKLYVDNETHIQKGNALFRVESTATEEEKSTAYAKYQSALSSLITAQNSKQTYDGAMWAKQKALLDAQNNRDYRDKKKDYASPKEDKDYTDLEKRSVDSAMTQAQKDFQAAEQAYKKADAAIIAAEALAAEAKLAYNAMLDITVKSPATGVVVNLQKRTGDQVLADPIQTLLVIADFGNPVITASVNEVNIPRMRVGQKAKIVFDALPDKTFMGTVDAIDSVGIKTQGAITYNARVVVDDLTEDIKPSMTASITIETSKKENVITVPNSAIVREDEKFFIQRKSDKQGQLTEVILGLKGLTKTEVVSGISVGDRIYFQE